MTINFCHAFFYVFIVGHVLAVSSQQSAMSGQPPPNPLKGALDCIRQYGLHVEQPCHSDAWARALRLTVRTAHKKDMNMKW